MALYITTVEDICSDRNLAKTACTLCSDDLLILLLSDDSMDFCGTLFYRKECTCSQGIYKLRSAAG